MNFFRRWQGRGQPLPEPYPIKSIITSSVTAGLVIAGLFFLTEKIDRLLIMGSFAASSLIVFGLPESPFAQPRNVIGGHFIGSTIGLIAFTYLSSHWWAAAVAVALTMATMKLTRTVHPPATSNPLVIFIAYQLNPLHKPTWGFILFPTLVGACLIILVALFKHNLHRTKQWPLYWY
jgi:CBS-domain-containing membrane protein